MIPSRRSYFLLIAGIIIAPILTIFMGISTSIAVILVFDATILVLMFVDSWRSQNHRVEITREVSPRLSIARDNPVELTVKSQKSPAIVEICDYYPSGFAASAVKLRASISPNSTQ